MKATFFLALLLGFAGVLAAGHFVPWGAHVRLPSQTRVVANGGRAEQFLIRLPADRIDAAGAKAAGSAPRRRRAPARCRRSSPPSRCSSSTSRSGTQPAT